MGKRCMGCMQLLKDGETVCPRCGHEPAGYRQPEFALPLETQLHAGKYLVGKVLGQGGFGITYLGLDQSLEMKVAIKEYYPQTMAYRSEGSSALSWHTSVANRQLGRDGFVKEARKMAKIAQIPSIVQVRDIFFENETAYIIMNYIEGETLKARLERTGPLDEAACVEMLTPVMQSLAKAHAEGLIHRDISPDNIMIDQHESIWLLDLGAAKELDPGQLTQNLTQSTNLVVRHGFSPLEQYMNSGEIGPWTDVYAMCATIYYCVSGHVPPFAVDRVYKPDVPGSDRISDDMMRVLEKGLALKANERFQDMDELIAALSSPADFVASMGRKEQKDVQPEREETKGTGPRDEKAKDKETKPDNTDTAGASEDKHKNPLPGWLIPAAGAAAVLAVVLGVVGMSGSRTAADAGVPPGELTPISTAADDGPQNPGGSVPVSSKGGTTGGGAAADDKTPDPGKTPDVGETEDDDAAKKAAEEVARKAAAEEAARKAAEEEAARKAAEEEAARKAAAEEAARKAAEEEAARKAAEEEAARKAEEEAKKGTTVQGQAYTFTTSKFFVNCLYTGGWKDGKPNGEGTMTMMQTDDRWSKGDTLWSADWVDGLIEGYGEWRSAVDGAYDGNFLHGLKSGYGKMWFSDGTVYDGQWSEGYFLG